MSKKISLEERANAIKVYKKNKREARRLCQSGDKSVALVKLQKLKDKMKSSGSYEDKKAYDGFKTGIAYSSFSLNHDPFHEDPEIPDGDIDVLMLAQDDWSNTGYRFSLCLKSLGLNVVILKGKKHIYDYPVQAPVHSSLSSKVRSNYPRVVRPSGPDKSKLRSLIRRSKVVHFFASTYIDVGLERELAKKHVVVQHGGTTYRTFPERSNKLFNGFCDAAVIQCPDLLGLGAKNEHLIYYPVQTDIIKPNFNKMGDKLLVGHFPSNPITKGTKEILKVIEKLQDDPEFKDKFEYIGVQEMRKSGKRTWKENINLMSKCDVLIETMNLKQGSKVFGEWGNTAIEAAALGKIVLTNSITTDIYNKEYGEHGLNIVNNKDQLYNQLVRVIGLSDEELFNEKVKTRRWVVKNHSMNANALRLWSKIYKNFFPNLKVNLKIGE